MPEMNESHEALAEEQSRKEEGHSPQYIGVLLVIVAGCLCAAGFIAYNSDLAVEYRVKRARDNRDTESLIAYTQRGKPIFAMMALDGLVTIGDTSSISAIERLASHSDRAIRRKAIKAVAHLRKQDAVEDLVPSLHHSDRLTRLTALECIGDLIRVRFNLDDPEAPTPADLESIQEWISKRSRTR